MKQADIKNNLIRRIIEINDAKLLTHLDKLLKNDDAFLIRHFSSLEKKKKTSVKKPSPAMYRKWPEE